MTIITAAILTWGVVTFGAVHDWANVPLLLAVALTAGWMLTKAPQDISRGHALLWVVGALLLPVAAQLVPIQGPTLKTVAAANEHFVRQLDVVPPNTNAWWHPISVAPWLSVRSLIFLGAGAVWVAGLSRWFRLRSGSVSIARVLVFLGTVVGLLALAEKATFNGKIYWFWESTSRASYNYFGPFVNRNHFAGWMLLALALSTGYFLGQIAVAGRSTKSGLRNRVLWLDSPEASKIVLTGSALLLMAISLIWSVSRSGIAAATLALAILAVTSVFRMPAGARRRVAAVYVVLALLGAIAWKGIDAVSAAYANTATLQWRFGLWRDTVAPLRDFWLLGSGLNTYGRVMLLYPETDVMVHAEQAHNDYLQLAVEGGLLVIVPWLIAATFLVVRIASKLRQPQDEMTWWVRTGAVAGICGMALQEVSEFSLQIPGVALLFATLVAIAIHEPAPLTQGREHVRHKRGRRELQVV